MKKVLIFSKKQSNENTIKFSDEILWVWGLVVGGGMCEKGPIIVCLCL